MDIPTPTLYDALCRLLSPASSFLRDVEKLDRQDDHALTLLAFQAACIALNDAVSLEIRPPTLQATLGRPL
ncbi:hypothetical protein B0H14DRAFT_3442710 [Mycena olivaceomarginata]|nr:hypothetical protein B0H14DRAFT_3442710 [Mycena olivaceomarginata]